MSKPHAAGHDAHAADKKKTKDKDNDHKEGGGGSSLLPKIILGVFVGGVVITETALFFFAVPSADQVAQLAEVRLLKHVQNTEDKPTEGHATENENKPVEFPLGEFSVVAVPPGQRAPLRIEFKLFGTVRSKDKEKLAEKFKEISGRYRHNLILEIRNATPDELNENQLGLIQRRILQKSNQLLGEPLLLGVGFENYQVFEE